MVRRALGIGLACVGLLGSCGKPAATDHSGNADIAAPANPAAAMATSKACDILTEADAAKALGRNATKLDASGGAAGLDICQFGYNGERMMDSGQVSVTLHPNDLASMRQGVEAEKYAVEPVADLGDAAFWSKEVGLYVGKGNRTAIYMLGAGGMNEAETKRRTIELARATMARF